MDYLAVEPFEGGGQNSAHTHEVEHVDGDAEHGVDDGGDLAVLGARHQVTEADHREDGQREHERRWERPALGVGQTVVAVLDGLGQVALVHQQQLAHVAVPLVFVLIASNNTLVTTGSPYP